MGRPDQFRTIVVDDDPPLRRLLRLLLERDGRFEVISDADNGHDAIEQARVLQPDLLLLDLMMPLMNGFQALPRIRDASPNTKVIVLSMRSDNPIERECRELGAAEFLSKAMDDDELVKRIVGTLGPPPRVPDVPIATPEIFFPITRLPSL